MMLSICFIVIGSVVMIASFVLDSLLVEYARGKNVTSCHNHYSIQLSNFLSNESLIFYLPA
ncbi:hypothetical protein [Commensalibacter communis]|nr:hypothetical protein [Commensalibacter communis]